MWTRWLSLCLWFWVTAITIAEDDNSSNDGLYLYDDVQSSQPVIEIKRNDFFDKVPITKPRLVLFYMPSCPACRRYKNTFVNLGRDIKRDLWKTKLGTYAVSCEAHMKLCRDVNIAAYPTLKLTLDDGKTWKSVTKKDLTVAKMETILAQAQSAEDGDTETDEEDDDDEGEEDKLAPVNKDSSQEDQAQTARKLEEDEEDDAADEEDKEDDGPADEDEDKEEEEVEGDDKADTEEEDAEDDKADTEEDEVEEAKADDDDNDEDVTAEEEDEEKDDADEKEETDEELATNDEEEDGEVEVDSNKEEDDEEEEISDVKGDDADDEEVDGGNDPEEEEDDKDGDLLDKDEEDGTEDVEEGEDEDAEDKDKDGDEVEDSEELAEEKLPFGDHAFGNEIEKTDDDDDDENVDEDDEQENQESDDKEEDEDEDENSDDGSGPFQNTALQPGAIKARSVGQRFEDPILRGEIQQNIQERSKRRGGGLFLRKTPLARKNHKFETTHLKMQQPREGATETMVAHQPFSKEFLERRKSILDAIEKKKGYKVRQKVERRWKEIERSRGNIGLPFKKDVLQTKQRLVQHIPIVKRAVAPSPEEDLMLDTSLSMIRGLRLGVYKTKGPLTFAKKRALTDWLELMSATLPEEWGIHDTIDDLLKNIDYISKAQDNLWKILDRHSMVRKKYSPSCSKGDSAFTCGFWKLLHTMSIGLAQHRGGQTLIDSGMRKPDTRIFSPSEAAVAVRDYMDNFFLCDPCSTHFVATFDDCSKNRRCDRLANAAEYATDADWKEMAKWMWEVHNDINVRLVREHAQENKNKKRGGFFGGGGVVPSSNIAALFPSIDACVKCFGDDGSWNEEAVFLFLEYEYWPSTTFDPKMNRLLKFEQGFDAEGAGLFWFLLVLGITMLVMLNQNKRALQQTILAAKSASLNVRQASAMAAPKRSD